MVRNGSLVRSRGILPGGENHIANAPPLGVLLTPQSPHDLGKALRDTLARKECLRHAQRFAVLQARRLQKPRAERRNAPEPYRALGRMLTGGLGRNRTTDTRIFNPLKLR